MAAVVKETSYAEFSKKIHGLISPTSRRPINGTIEVTRRCNLSCVHCYNNLPPGDPEARARELTLEEHRRIYSFTAGGLSKRDELIYEVAVPVAFLRKDLSPDPAYLELLAFNIGSSSRRVLTWELQ